MFSQPDRYGQSIKDYLKHFDQDTDQSFSITGCVQSAAGGKVLHSGFHARTVGAFYCLEITLLGERRFGACHGITG